MEPALDWNTRPFVKGNGPFGFSRLYSAVTINNSGLFRFRFHFDPSFGTEELGHLEMIGAIVHQLTRNLKDSAFAPYFVDHTAGVYPTAASGFPWSAASMQVKGDPIADLAEDLGAEATFH